MFPLPHYAARREMTVVIVSLPFPCPCKWFRESLRTSAVGKEAAHCKRLGTTGLRQACAERFLLVQWDGKVLNCSLLFFIVPVEIGIIDCLVQYLAILTPRQHFLLQLLYCTFFLLVVSSVKKLELAVKVQFPPSPPNNCLGQFCYPKRDHIMT